MVNTKYFDRRRGAGDMLTIDEIRRKKEECRYTNEQLSKLSGVPLATVQKVMGKVTR